MPDPPLHPIFTVGYGQRDLEELLAILRRYEIQYLVDVRSVPYSRFKPEFSRAPLEAALAEGGIRFLYMGEALGGQPEDPACYTHDKVDYAKVRTKAFFYRGLERLEQGFRQQHRIVLLCSEGRPEECHRSKLIGASLDALGVPVMHIDENGALKSQAEVIGALTGDQLSLFGEPAFSSRKRYPEKK